MNTQLIPESCGWEVSEWWCPLTDLMTYFIIFVFSIVSTIVIYKYVYPFFKEAFAKQKVREGEE